MTQTHNEATPTEIANNHDSLAVLAYRMGAVERNVQTVIDKFDGVAQFYVTTATLMLTLDPLKDRITDLENADKEREKQRTTEQGQFKLAIAMAVVAPLVSIVVNLMINK